MSISTYRKNFLQRRFINRVVEVHVSKHGLHEPGVIVRVSDVYPDGKSIDYPWRLRYREGFDREVLIEPRWRAAVPRS